MYYNDKVNNIQGELTMAKDAIAVLTSGGDAPGMNAAVRAVVRSGINKGLMFLVSREVTVDF